MKKNLEINWQKGLEELEKAVKEAGGTIVTWWCGTPIIKW